MRPGIRQCQEILIPASHSRPIFVLLVVCHSLPIIFSGPTFFSTCSHGESASAQVHSLPRCPNGNHRMFSFPELPQSRHQEVVDRAIMHVRHSTQFQGAKLLLHSRHYLRKTTRCQSRRICHGIWKNSRHHSRRQVHQCALSHTIGTGLPAGSIKAS